MNIIDSLLIDNNSRGKVGEFLEKNIESGSKLSIVSAYFTIYAYEKLKDKFDSIEELDFLFEDPKFIKMDEENKAFKAYSLDSDEGTLHINDQIKQKYISKICLEWIEEKVNIKSIKNSNLLHGKMYHIEKENGIQKAVIGSSNLTCSGLGLSNNSNIELNIELDSDRDRKDLKNWFKELWNDENLVEDVKEEVIKYLKQLYKENSPNFIYYKTLYHIFEDYLKENKKIDIQDDLTGFYDTKIWNMLYDFQKEGVKAAINKIEKNNGCIIADSVGLGKTFEALAVIKYFENKNMNVLVICPKKLHENWKTYKSPYKTNPLTEDKLSYKIIYHTDLSRESGLSKAEGMDLEKINWSSFDLVVIDESHNFRNDTKGKKQEDGNYKKSRYEKLLEDIIKEGQKTRVLLLSATPVNNSLQDLRNQIRFIFAGDDQALNRREKIYSIDNTIITAQKQFTRWSNKRIENDLKTEDLLDNLDSSFFKLLDELTIARSRKHVINFYDYSEIKKFPSRNKPESIYSDIDLENEFPTYDEVYEIINKYELSLFRPSKYLKEEFKDKYKEQDPRYEKIFNQEKREGFLVGMMRVNLLKRLESSIHSFQLSIKRTIDKIEALEEKIRINEIRNDDELELDDNQEEILSEYLEENDDDDITVGKKLKYKLNHLELEEWKNDLLKDKNELKNIYSKSIMIDFKRDEKLEKLKKTIKQKIKNPINFIDDNNNKKIPNKKVIVFTAFSDTAEYIYESIYNWAVNEMNLNIACVYGSNTKTNLKYIKNDFDNILTKFSPRSKIINFYNNGDIGEEIDILIATDCISEGQNLQDCDMLINYDIHWNPVRIIQRFGRIDRIGSANDRVQMVNFWPTEDLNKYIDLKDRVEARMALVDITATGDDNMFEEETNVEDIIEEDLKFRQKQLLRLKDEVLDLEDMDNSVNLSDFSLDDFRADIANYLKKEDIVEKAPIGLYAIVPSPRGEYRCYDNKSKFTDRSKDIIKPGVIYCFRHKKNHKELEKINPLQPYYLTYIYDDGTVKYSYSSTKQILDIFRGLCFDKEKPYEKLCDIFNKKTSNGKEIENYIKLSKKSVETIVESNKKTNLKQLQRSRRGIVVPDKDMINNNNDLELITWLIII